MPQTIGLLVGYLAVPGYVASTGAIIGAVVEVAAVAGSLVYQQSQKKKAKAAAARLRREQQLQASAMQNKLKKLSKSSAGGFDGGSFSSVNGPRDITAMIRRSTASRRVVYGRARLGGIWAYCETTGTSNEVLHLILALCEGPVDAIETIYFDDEEVPINPVTGLVDGRFHAVATVKKYLGNPGQTAEPDLAAHGSTRWTAEHRLEGIAYIYVRIRVDLELFSSIPEISAVVRGKNDILDPRTNTRGYSTNPALCLNDYLTTSLTGPGIDPGDIDQPELINAANVCDEIVPTLLGTEKRYTCQGAIDLASTVEDNALLFVQSMNGDLIQSGGKFTIQAGQYVTPTFTIDINMLAGGIEFSSLQPRKDRANVVKGTYLAEANQWQKFDFPSVRDSAAITQDGQEVVSDLTLELVGSGSQAQRLAGMELRQSRRGRSVQLTCNLKAMRARVGSNVFLNIPRYFDNDVYRVVESKFSVGNDGAPTVTLTLLENHPDIYEWDITKEKLINIPPDLSAKSPQTGKPVYSPLPEEESEYPLDVTITSLTPGAVIRWSKDLPPETADAGTAYTEPVTVEEGDFLYARAFRAGYLASALNLEVYI